MSAGWGAKYCRWSKICDILPIYDLKRHQIYTDVTRMKDSLGISNSFVDDMTLDDLELLRNLSRVLQFFANSTECYTAVACE